MNKILLLLASILILVVSACGAVTPYPQPPLSTAIPTLPNLPVPSAVEPTQTDLSPVLPTPVSGGGYPAGALQARADLAARLNLPVEQVEVTGITAKDWPDACLGLPATGEMCAEMITSGFEVILTAGNAQYRYRTDVSGNNIRMQGEAVPAAGGEQARTLLEWTGTGCEMFSVSTQGAFYGQCGQSLKAVTSFDGGLEPLKTWLKTFAPFEAGTPAGKLKFTGLGLHGAGMGLTRAAPADQRMMAEWARLQFDAAQSGRTGAAWGLVFGYHREGGIAGFCDDVGVYLDGRVVVSSCKGVNTTLYLTTSELQKIYDWYDSYAPLDYSYSDPAVADKMTTTLTMPGKGQKTAGDEEIRAMLDFISGLDARATFSFKADASMPAAEQVLVDYFRALNGGDFIRGAKLYGGSTDLLKTWNPDIVNDLPAWLERGCKQNGLQCLLPRSIRYRGPDAHGGHQFLVEFNLPDGSLFVQGPCCGEAPGPGNASFIFTVLPVGSDWKVMDLPPYVP